MRAMVLENQPGELSLRELPVPEPGPGQVLIRVSTCGVCRTDLHIVDADLTEPKLPLVPGHQIVGTVEAAGTDTDRFEIGDRIGVPWLGWVDGVCRFCQEGRENLCENARFTGYDIDGGYAEFAVADQRFCFRLPEGIDDVHVAPLLCAGMIGYRAMSIAGDGERLGLYGFGSSAHILCQIAAAEGRRIFAFTKPGDREGQEFARSLGAEWAGGSDETPPEPLDAAIVFAPVGRLMIDALKASERGARIVSAGIHMSDIPSFPYELLWEERSLHSVANLTRADGTALLDLAARHGVSPKVEVLPLEAANQALGAIRSGASEGSTVLTV
ncbi:MAG: zinc-dependent alcohol dehydrogenase family protein [Solirubrobacterales bacterium]|nr:zinc-dependent alcohol dehydrogenase family protein [Solirubrobacterales bacterium]OJU95364.1 MAG: alcohol dehydrogenase [Solirubrobacterales bacterium 67-14]